MLKKNIFSMLVKGAAVGHLVIMQMTCDEDVYFKLMTCLIIYFLINGSEDSWKYCFSASASLKICCRNSTKKGNNYMT